MLAATPGDVGPLSSLHESDWRGGGGYAWL